MINILKNIGIITIMLASLGVLGTLINYVVPWVWLTNFFTILRYFANVFAWTWDVDTMFTIMGISLTILGGLWTFKATLAVTNYLKNN